MNGSALPKVRVNVDEFLAWSQRRPDDAGTDGFGTMEDFTAASMRCCLIVFAERRAIVRCAHNGAGTTEAIPVSVAALLGS